MLGPGYFLFDLPQFGVVPLFSYLILDCWYQGVVRERCLLWVAGERLVQVAGLALCRGHGYFLFDFPPFLPSFHPFVVGGGISSLLVEIYQTMVGFGAGCFLLGLVAITVVVPEGRMGWFCTALYSRW